MVAWQPANVVRNVGRGGEQDSEGETAEAKMALLEGDADLGGISDLGVVRGEGQEGVGRAAAPRHHRVRRRLLDGDAPRGRRPCDKAVAAAARSTSALPSSCSTAGFQCHKK